MRRPAWRVGQECSQQNDDMFAHKLTYAVGAAELSRGDVLHVAMETEEDLNGVNLHLQSAG